MTCSTTNDVAINERLQPISVETRYCGRYQSEVCIRDLKPYSLDEPKELGGQNMGPTPLENVLASLCSCTSMIVHIMQREMGFKLDTMRSRAEGTIDVRRVEMKRTGKKYSEVEPLSYHFYDVHQEIHISTVETDERLEELKQHVAKLCPVSRLLEDAGVPLRVDWIRE